jgi:hypothetical protein
LGEENRGGVVSIGNEFCIDSKVFKLAFDGGRVDPYHIMERRNRFRGSLWIGITGLRWLLDIFVKIRTTNQPLEGFFVFHRDGYRFLEFSCLANRGGRFVEITEYHSGTHRGSIRIPEGRKGAGWSVFEFQVRKCFLGETQKLSAIPTSSGRISDDGVTAERDGTSRNKEMKWSWKSRKSRRTKSAPDLIPSVMSRNLRNENSKLVLQEPRPTRSFHFEWKPKSRTLRIMLDQMSRREVSWVDLEEGVGPKAQKLESGLIMNGPQSFSLYKAHSEEDLEQACLEAQAHALGDETQNPMGSMEEIEPSSDAEGSGSGLVCEPGMMDSLIEDEQNQGPDPSSPAAAQADDVSHILRSAGMDIPRELTHHERAGEADSDDGLGTEWAQAGAVVEFNVAEVPVSISEASPLTLAHGFEAEGPLSPFSCTPIMMVEPTVSSPVIKLLGDGIDALYHPSQWVAQQMNAFRKQVGVSIRGHEAECLALLRKIEADRKPKKINTSIRKTTRKGTRELRNLVSSVNYGGKQVSCC